MNFWETSMKEHGSLLESETARLLKSLLIEQISDVLLCYLTFGRSLDGGTAALLDSVAATDMSDA